MSRRRPTIGAQFAARRIDMLRSPAYRALSLSAHRILARLEIEFANHGGTDNGRLPVTYDDFEQYGIHRHAIAPAIREVVALGFVEITEAGRAGNAEWRRPNRFRLTYRHAKGVPEDGSHEWMRISEEDAPALAAKARLAEGPKKQNCGAGKRQISVRKPHRKSQIHSAETTTTCRGAGTTTTLDISGRLVSNPGREARPSGSAEASDPARLEDTAAVQNRIAMRIGSDGWIVLGALPDDELERLTELEQAGNLTDEVLALAVAAARLGQS
jgi:hypothetical protein